MQIVLPNIKTVQACIGLFDYIIASRDSDDANVIFNSDLNLENLQDIPGGQTSIKDQKIPASKEILDFLAFVLKNFDKGFGQVFQDLYVLWKLQGLEQGIFVEIGTAYPTGHNNTYLLESKMKWSGVCVEPNPSFHQNIKTLRTSPLDTRAIFPGTPHPIKMRIPLNFHAGGGIAVDHEEKVSAWTIDKQDEITVMSVSLTDCLTDHNIPKLFDFLSFDTTGNRHDIESIYQALDYGFRPRVITLGHNYKTHRPDMHNMLQSFGYAREFDCISRWDEWYYHPDYLQIP